MFDIENYPLLECWNPYYNSSSIDFNEAFLAHELQQAISSLSPQHPFEGFSLGLKPEEINILEHLHINRDLEYINYGDLQKLPTELKSFIEELGNENNLISSSLADIISNLVNNIVASSKQGDTAWVIVRGSTASDKFDLPDWHTDTCIGLNLGDLDKGCKDNEYNVVFTLKGAPTLFYLMPDEEREEFSFKADTHNYAFKEGISPENQKQQELAKMLKDSSPVSVDFGYGSVFLAGDNNYGAVHTAPPINEERLFIATYIANKDEIKQLEEIIRINI